MSYATFSYKMFGDLSRSMRPYFIDIKDDMQKASMNYTLEEYLSMALLTTMLTFVVESAFISFILGLFVEPILAMMGGVVLSLGISGLLFFIFYAYPVTLAKHREGKVKKVLPFAVSYLATMSSSKMPPINLFKTLGTFKEYGEVADEAKNIANSVDVFGLTVSSAIKKQAKITPSKEMRDLLWGMNTILASGGDLTSFLKDKREELMNDYRRRIRKYAQDLGLYTEIYLTLIITGSIFFIVLSSIIASLSAGVGIVVIQSFVVFVLTPLLSLGFIVLIKSVSPLE